MKQMLHCQRGGEGGTLPACAAFGGATDKGNLNPRIKEAEKREPQP